MKNSTKDKRERVGRLLQMHANSRQEIDTVYSGDIAAAVGLKNRFYVVRKTTLSWNQWNSQSQLSTYLLNQNLKLTKIK